MQAPERKLRWGRVFFALIVVGGGGAGLIYYLTK